MITFHNEDNMDFMAAKPDNFYDLAIIDPPYGIGEADGKNASRNKGFGKGNKSKKLAYSKDYGKKKWDDKPADKAFFIELKRVSKNQIIFGANHFIENIPNANSSCWIVWDKDNGESDFADCELAYCSLKTAVRKVKIRWNGLLQQDMKNKEIRIHPTQKPTQLYRWLLQNYAETGFKILDTHGGSGSIAIACDMEGFDLDICEIDKEYFDASVKRYNTYKSQLKLF